MGLPRQKGLAQLLGRWTELRSAETALWAFSQATLGRYQLRDGGASQLLLVRQQRGDWRSAASVRRYDKHGRVGLQLQWLPVDTRQHLLALLPESAVLFSKYFVRLCAQVNREKDVSLSSSTLALAAPPKRLRIVGKQS